jgi:hypothetical protein
VSSAVESVKIGVDTCKPFTEDKLKVAEVLKKRGGCLWKKSLSDRARTAHPEGRGQAGVPNRALRIWPFGVT